MALALASCLYGPASAMPLAPGDILDAFSQVAPRTGERFEPALGFLDEAGVTRNEGNVGWWHRTEAGHDIVPGIDWNLRRRLDGSERLAPGDYRWHYLICCPRPPNPGRSLPSSNGAAAATTPGAATTRG